jgi:signal transduction histidine kinase
VLCAGFLRPAGHGEQVLTLLLTMSKRRGLSRAILARRAHRQLESERATLSAIIDGASDGVVLVDEQRRVHVFNAALEALTGRPAAQTLGQTCVHALGCRDVAGLPGCEGGCPFERVLRTGTSLPYLETVLETAEGQHLTVASSYAPVHGMADGHAYGVAIVRDVRVRTDAEQLKRTFIAMVSHELRTPLALIRGYTETLRHLDLDDGTKDRLVVELDEATERLAGIVDDILDVSSFDAGRLRLRFELVSISALVHEVVAEHGEQAPGHRIMTRCCETPLTALWDARRMRQVLANLISNAIKYSPQGGRILVRTWTEGDDVLLSVTDEGIGIARQDMPRLFGRFQRLESSAVRGAPGSGLGLYICRCIVAAHGGDIQAESPPARHGGASLPPDWHGGTIFTVRVPQQTSAHGGVCEEATL